MGRLVTLSGVDCAGKSTQLALLEARLLERGLTVKQVWFRPGYGPELDRLRAWVRGVRPGALPRANEPSRRAQGFSRPGVSEAWLCLAYLDTLLQFGAKVRYWLKRFDVVLCDRYLDDARIDLELRFPELMERHGRRVRSLYSLCPRPDAALLLTLPESVALARMALKCEPFPDSDEVRKARFERYLDWSRSGAVVNLNADASIAEVEARVQDALCQSGVRT